MGIEDDIAAIREQGAHTEAIWAAWRDVSGSGRDPILAHPTGDWKALVDEVLPLVHWQPPPRIVPTARMSGRRGYGPGQYERRIYTAPDGTTRLSEQLTDSTEVKQRFTKKMRNVYYLCPGRVEYVLAILCSHEIRAYSPELLLTRDSLFWVNDEISIDYARQQLVGYLANA